jgi:hypothetical protein
LIKVRPTPGSKLLKGMEYGISVFTGNSAITAVILSPSPDRLLF